MCLAFIRVGAVKIKRLLENIRIKRIVENIIEYYNHEPV